MTDQGRKIFSGIIRTAVKLGIAAAVIIWLYLRHSSELFAALKNIKLFYLLPVLLLTLTAAFAGMVRWKELAAAIGIKLSLFKAVSLTMQGVFFSLVIPGGAIGGDVIKMAALSGHIRQGTRTEGFFSIIIDRIVGMFALFLLAIALLCFSYPLFANLDIAVLPGLSGVILWWIIIAICLAGIAGGTALFFHKKIECLPGVKPLIAFIDRKTDGKAARISLAADTYGAKKKNLFMWVVITIFFIHLLPAVSMYLLLAATGTAAAFLTVAAAVTAGNIAGLIPLFPGGIGARDAVTIALLAAGGIPVESAAAAQLTATLFLIIFNLSGAIFFIADRKNSSAAK